MKQAALELSGYIRDEILAKGAKYVRVLTTTIDFRPITYSFGVTYKF
jgi:hypothetical protein